MHHASSDIFRLDLFSNFFWARGSIIAVCSNVSCRNTICASGIWCGIHRASTKLPLLFPSSSISTFFLRILNISQCLCSGHFWSLHRTVPDLNLSFLQPSGHVITSTVNAHILWSCFRDAQLRNGMGPFMAFYLTHLDIKTSMNLHDPGCVAWDASAPCRYKIAASTEMSISSMSQLWL